MPVTNFAKILDTTSAFFVGKYSPHIQFGIGNSIHNSEYIYKYISILAMHPSFPINDITIEISVTLLNTTDYRTIVDLVDYIDSHFINASVIIECIIDPLISSTDFCILEDNISRLASDGIKLHLIMRFTNGLKKIGSRFIDLLNRSSIDFITVDYFFKDGAIGSKYNYADYEDWCLRADEDKLMVYPGSDIHDLTKATSSEFIGIFCDLNLDVSPLVITPFGDIILPSPFNLNSCDSSNFSLRYNSIQQRLSMGSYNDSCKKCEFYSFCPSSSIDLIELDFNSPITDTSCLFGKRILHHLSNRL
jgi:hypothetical protein